MCHPEHFGRVATSVVGSAIAITTFQKVLNEKYNLYFKP